MLALETNTHSNIHPIKHTSAAGRYVSQLQLVFATSVTYCVICPGSDTV